MLVWTCDMCGSEYDLFRLARTIIGWLNHNDIRVCLIPILAIDSEVIDSEVDECHPDDYCVVNNTVDYTCTCPICGAKETWTLDY